MTDAEYEELKYAAIAAGYKPVRLSDDGRSLLMWGIDDPWNPREDDRDAFRLMAHLDLSARRYDDLIEVCAVVGSAWYRLVDVPALGRGDIKALRLAITRAAAEFGKQMGGGDV